MVGEQTPWFETMEMGCVRQDTMYYIRLFQYSIIPGSTGDNRKGQSPTRLGFRHFGGGWTKIVLRGDLRVLSGVMGGFRHSGGGLDVS
jgi:hypothetical protein